MNKKKAIDALLERLRTCNPHEVEALMEQIEQIRNKDEDGTLISNNRRIPAKD